jgi:menaquinone-dependent protoporphyrinogen oxidase
MCDEKCTREAAMKDPVLVAYATRYGSTQEVAEAVAESMREAGLEVDIKRLREVKILEGYRAVVVGAPLFMFHWHKDALGFLERHQEALARLPVMVFALGPFHDEEKEWADVRAQLEKELAKLPWLRPADIKIFGGKFDPQKLRLPSSLLPAMKKIPASDIRDWEAIRAWGTDLAARFQPREG